MRRFSMILASIAAIALVVAVDVAPAQEVQEAPITLEQAALQDGHALYAELCAVCHGMDAKGNGPAAPALAKPATDLTQLALANGGEFPAAEVQDSITGQTSVVAHGTLEMPVWGRAFEDVRMDRKPGARWGFARLKVLALTEYIESIQVETEEK